MIWKLSVMRRREMNRFRESPQSWLIYEKEFFMRYEGNNDKNFVLQKEKKVTYFSSHMS